MNKIMNIIYVFITVFIITIIFLSITKKYKSDCEYELQFCVNPNKMWGHKTFKQCQIDKYFCEQGKKKK